MRINALRPVTGPIRATRSKPASKQIILLFPVAQEDRAAAAVVANICTMPAAELGTARDRSEPVRARLCSATMKRATLAARGVVELHRERGDAPRARGDPHHGPVDREL
jgi:hypothetical protein